MQRCTGASFSADCRPVGCQRAAAREALGRRPTEVVGKLALKGKADFSFGPPLARSVVGWTVASVRITNRGRKFLRLIRQHVAILAVALAIENLRLEEALGRSGQVGVRVVKGLCVLSDLKPLVEFAEGSQLVERERPIEQPRLKRLVVLYPIASVDVECDVDRLAAGVHH